MDECKPLAVGVMKDLPLGKKYLELSAAQGFERAAALLKEIRKCMACGKLVLHHLICLRCHDMRYCNIPTDPYKLNYVEWRESLEAGGSSPEPAYPSADSN